MSAGERTGCGKAARTRDKRLFEVSCGCLKIDEPRGLRDSSSSVSIKVLPVRALGYRASNRSSVPVDSRHVRDKSSERLCSN
jgi:hypothetical protein